MKPITRRTDIGSVVTEKPATRPSPEVGRKQRRQEADRRALAGAVGPDETEDLTLADGEAQVVDGDEISVALGEVDHLDHESSYSVSSGRSRLIIGLTWLGPVGGGGGRRALLPEPGRASVERLSACICSR